MAFLEVIIRNGRAEVVDVVKADVAGKPLEDFRQFIERAALERGSAVIPISAAFPVDVFELVLDVKQPNASGSGDGNDNELKRQVSLPAKREAQGRANE